MSPKTPVSSGLRRTLGYAGLARGLLRLKRESDAAALTNARRHVVERMGKLRGLPQKLGQLLSMTKSGDEAASYVELCDAASPMSIELVRELLAEEWQRDVDDVVATLQADGHAASLGQVHRATLLDGRDVAIKVQYPGIESAIRTDLKALGWMSIPVGDLSRGFDLAAYRKIILADLERELDYVGEAARQRHYREIVGDGWVVPAVVDEWCTARVLVSEWQRGEPIEAVAEWPEAERKQLSRTLIRGFTSTLFEFGCLHADPHPGNYRFRRAQHGVEIVLYDFGSVFDIDGRGRRAILELIRRATARSGDPFPLFLALGFDRDLLEPIRDKLGALAIVLLEPFDCPGVYDLSDWCRTARIDDILGDWRWNFRMSGPASLMFLMRAYQGLIYYLDRIGVPVSWSIPLREHLECATNQWSEDADDGVDEPEAAVVAGFETLAKALRVEVIDRGRTKVALSFPAARVDQLESLIDGDVRERIDARGIQLDVVLERVRGNAYSPQVLFELEESASQRGIRVWLE